jgi:hypothetical protein
MWKLLVVGMLLCALLAPSAFALVPVQCLRAMETSNPYDWMMCGLILVALNLLMEGSGGYVPLRTG